MKMMLQLLRHVVCPYKSVNYRENETSTCLRNNNCNFGNMLLVLIDRLIPQHLQQEQQKLRQARLLIAASLLVLSYMIPHAILYAVVSYWYGFWLCIFTTFTPILLILIFRKNGNLIFGGNFFAFSAAIFFLGLIFSSGGSTSPIMAWLITIPICAFLFANARSGYIWAVLMGMFYVIFLILDLQGFHYSIDYPQEFSPFVRFASYLGLLVYIIVITQIYETGHQRLNHQLISANKSILQQKLDLEKAWQELKDNIEYASYIQTSLLPSDEEVLSNYTEGFIFYRPKDNVSGDFFWSANIGDTTILVVADCTGHGISAALLTIMGMDFLEEIVNGREITQPQKILVELERRFQKSINSHSFSPIVHDGMNVSIITWDTKHHQLFFAGAKHPLLLVSDSSISFIKGSIYSIGGKSILQVKNFDMQEIELKKGDKVYLYSDGFQDQFGENKGKFLSTKFRTLLLETSHLNLTEQKQKLIEVLADWQGHEVQTDDILVVGLGF